MNGLLLVCFAAAIAVASALPSVKPVAGAYAGYGYGHGVRYFRDSTGNTVPVAGKDQNKDGVDDRLDSNRDGKEDPKPHYGHGYAGYGLGHPGYGHGAAYGHGHVAYGHAGHGHGVGYGHGVAHVAGYGKVEKKDKKDH